VIVQIGSAGDPHIADYARVGDAAWLAAAGLFVAEGRLLVERLTASGRFPIHSILLTPTALGGFGGAADIAEPVYVAEPAVLEQITGIRFHRGCLALARREVVVPAETFEQARVLLALEGVGNPDNVGGLFRVAAAFGVNGLLLDPATGDPFYRKAVRTSMGAVLTLPFARVSPWPDVLDSWKVRGFRVVALTPRADARPLVDVAREPRVPMIVLVGSEGPGLSAAAMRAADVLVRIPTTADVDSLNVAVAAGIALSQLGSRIADR
jgi:tRNA G18 (ribose-2'-O)-methylase SpoU